MQPVFAADTSQDTFKQELSSNQYKLC